MAGDADATGLPVSPEVLLDEGRIKIKITLVKMTPIKNGSAAVRREIKNSPFLGIADRKSYFAPLLAEQSLLFNYQLSRVNRGAFFFR
jgi:hypothetical protein